MHDHDKLRIFRVGIVNSGDSVSDVSIKFARITPELPRVFPMQELQQTHQKEEVSRFTVNKSNEPLVYVDVIYQRLHSDDGKAGRSADGKKVWAQHRKGETFHMYFKFAAHEPEIPLTTDEYLIWLAVDGPGAGEQLKLVLRKNKAGQYDMSEAFH